MSNGRFDLLECKNWENEGALRLADLAPRGGRKWGHQMMLQVISYRTGEWITFAPDNDRIRSLPDWYKFARDELG